MYAVKDTTTGKFYTGKKAADQKWGARCEARWMPAKTTAKAVVGGLRNSPALRAQVLRIVSINE